MVDEENKPTIKPLTIKPITIKPNKITPIDPSSGANPTPSISINPNPQQAAANGSVGSPTIRLKPPTGVSIPTPGATPAASPINLKTPAQAPITSKAPTTSMPRVIPDSEDDGKATMRIRPPAAPTVAPAIKIAPVTPVG